MTVHTNRIPGPHCITPQAWRAMMRPRELTLPFSQGRFPFMILPKEIRDLIYQELLVADIPLQLINDRPLWPDLYGPPGKQLHSTILRLSKQVHYEASRVLYGNNTFYVSIDGGAVGSVEVVYTEDGTEIPLPPSVRRYIPLLRQVVIYSGVPSRCMTKLRCQWLLGLIELDIKQLFFFAMLFPNWQTFRMNEQLCEYWLTPVNGREIRQKHVWFPVKELGKMACAWWLVMKPQDGQRGNGFVSDGDEVVL
ncbi:hypothetical protein BCR34DRAFT_184376 [Clohesyomyces aquaticus]|uniref:Uncharacterized protein n=1 Tax=Clohesyomyces aquaticus TaxID=1231657 RepID=A0A1Y1YE98_9PLEO|nr:hypothetical protein BCR34DRAFT_184376 [Clohesyomyces aquaticus]